MRQEDDGKIVSNTVQVGRLPERSRGPGLDVMDWTVSNQFAEPVNPRLDSLASEESPVKGLSSGSGVELECNRNGERALWRQTYICGYQGFFLFFSSLRPVNKVPRFISDHTDHVRVLCFVGNGDLSSSGRWYDNVQWNTWLVPFHRSRNQKQHRGAAIGCLSWLH